jgi:hypothetical protein
MAIPVANTRIIETHIEAKKHAFIGRVIGLLSGVLVLGGSMFKMFALWLLNKDSMAGGKEGLRRDKN